MYRDVRLNERSFSRVQKRQRARVAYMGRLQIGHDITHVGG
jgi:hypothetical protein